MKMKFLASTAALAGLLFAGSAQAYLVETLEGGLPPGGQYALDCDDGCFGFVGTGPSYALDNMGPPYNAQAYKLSNSSTATELAKLNAILGGAGFSPVTSVYKPPAAENTSTWSTNKEYFSIKIGQQTTFYKNMTTGTLDLAFLRTDGGERSVNWSHLTEYGDPVPLPGAVWLFGSALVGLVALNRRRRLAA